MKHFGYLRYITALLLFGSCGVLSDTIHLSSYEIVFLRTILGFLVITVLFFLSRQRIKSFQYKKEALFVLLSGFSMGLNWMFLFEGYARIGVSLSVLLCYCGPMIVMLLSPIFFKERLTAVKLIGFVAVVCGVVLTNGKVFVESGDIFGFVCGGLAALTYAGLVMFNKKATHIVGLENSVLQLFASCFTVAVFLVFKDGGLLFPVPSDDWLSILVLGILNTGIACYLYFSGLGRLPVQSAAVCGYLEPLSAVILAAVVLHEVLSPLQLLGVVLILGGALFAECYKKRETKTE